MILQIRLEVNDNQLKELAHMARGYMRVNPRVSWKKDEYKEAARMAIQQITAGFLDSVCDVKSTETLFKCR